MKTFACTFKGFATMYIEATDENAARNEALKRAIEGNEIVITDELTVRQVS